MDAQSVAIIVALLSLAGTVVTAILTSGKVSKSEAVGLENRLTKLEVVAHTHDTPFTPGDKACLIDLNVKMGLIWNVIGRDLPMGFKKVFTPKLDALIDEATNKGTTVSFGIVKAWPIDKQRLFIDLLEEQKRNTVKGENGNTLFGLAVYIDALKLELGQITPEDVLACRVT